MTPAESALRQIEQQILAARPWDAAEHESLWVITGQRPGNGGRFTDCLAMTAPYFMTGADYPLFFLIAPSLGDYQPIDPAWITTATPLLLVHRDNPATAYWAEDQDVLDAGLNR